METHSTRRSAIRRVVGSAVLGVALTAFVVAGVSANGGAAGGGPGGPGGGPGGPGGGDITISAISGTQLTLVTADGWTRTVDVAGATVMNGTTTIALGDLKVGDEIAVRQSRNFDGTVTVVEIDTVAPHLDGTVTAVSGSTLTIQAADGTTHNVTLTATTTYHANRGNGTEADVTVGSVAHVEGTSNADGSFTATSVSVRPASLGGTVKAVGADSITVADASGATATIKVTSTTTYSTATGTGTLASVTVGSAVRAEGIRGTDGSLSATSVRIGTATDGFGRGMGGPGPGGFGGGHRGPGDGNGGPGGSGGGAAAPASPAPSGAAPASPAPSASA